VAENRIIARATPAGTRRLRAVPLDHPLNEHPDPASPVAVATRPAPPTGLNAFLQAAQQQGAQLVMAAREQAEEIAQSARAEGYARGYDEGREAAARETADLLAFAEQTVRELVDTRTRILNDAESDLVELALAVAQKVMQATIDADPERVLGVLRGALRKAYVRDHVQVVCNPDDLAMIDASASQLEAQVGTIRNLELIGDRRVARGGVIVRTGGGDVDATLNSQLDRIREALLGRDDA
jgi:flagellar assembly protein FliH